MNAQLKEQSPVLSVTGLTTRLGESQNAVTAVEDVSFDLYPGQTLALLGESGCGKSMTALSLMRLLPSSGRVIDGDVHICDTSILELTEAQMRSIRGGRIGMIFQEPMTSLNPVMTIGEQIAESVRLHDREVKTRGDVKKRVIALLKDVRIPDPDRRYSEYPHQLSGGMKQRVMIAIALAGRPEVLIADEPTTALDVTIQSQVLSLLRQLQKEKGMAILLITHDLGVVAEMADQVAVMYAGQIIETASVNDFFKSPRHPYSQKLFASLPARQKRGQQLAVIKGQVPALNQVFTRCRFYDRCEMRLDDCQSALPPWQTVSKTADDWRGYRCFRDASSPASHQHIEAANTTIEKEPELVNRLNLDQLKVHFPIQKGLFKRTVGFVRAVDGVSLSIPQGRTLALVGESGCGKTTVGKALLQLIRPTGGSVQFDDIELTTLGSSELRSKRKDLQIIFQDPVSSMNPRMIVEDIIAEGLVAQNIGKNRADRARIVEDLLDKVGLPAKAAQRYPHEFSGGQRQRICIARALAVNPGLIVCDEPTSALDVSVQAQILNLLKDLQDKMGLSYLFITHDISVVSYLAHEVAVMYLGRIVEQGSIEDIFDRPAHPYTRSLLDAVPVPEPGAKPEQAILQGDMPSPSNPPAGCHFHPRCPMADDECSKAYPETKTLSDSHRVACFKAN
jgi:peptide/nickel transport system ATP-binding protein